jgi:hypothetical protein
MKQSVMFQRLKALAAWLMGRGLPPFDPTQDPYAGVREPRRRGPTGRNSAVALREPESETSVRAVGRVWRRPDPHQ